MEGFAKPPTDNLYKFMAIAGVAVFLGAGYISVNVMRETETSHRVYISAANKWIHEAQTVHVGFERRNTQYTALLAKLKAADDVQEIYISSLATDLDPELWAVQTPENRDLESLHKFFQSANGYVTARRELEKTIDNLESIQAKVAVMDIDTSRYTEISEQLRQCTELRVELSATVQTWENVRNCFVTLKSNSDRFKVSLNVMAFLGLCGIAAAVQGFRLWHRKVQIPLDEILTRDAGTAAIAENEYALQFSVFADGSFEMRRGTVALPSSETAAAVAEQISSSLKPITDVELRGAPTDVDADSEECSAAAIDITEDTAKASQCP